MVHKTRSTSLHRGHKGQAVCFFGEPLLELTHNSDGVFSTQVAGDVFNTAVYLKRLQTLSDRKLKAGLLCSVGNDQISNLLFDACRVHDIEADWVLRDPLRTIGLYSIELDRTGERSFVYWRQNSAARHVFVNACVSMAEKLAAEYGYFYLSGISLAITEDSVRDRMWAFLHRLKALGVQIVFDSNYRASLWPDVHQARREFINALQIADLVFAGVEDCQPLFSFTVGCSSALVQTLSAYTRSELIIKNGGAAVLYRGIQGELTVSIEPVSQIVDTTAAGDSFNSGFLFGWLGGMSIEDCVGLGASTAAVVIQHPGAIIDHGTFNQAMSDIFNFLSIS
ncbi:sugar kinase [Bowmanella sp. Y26]|uniref:sugar kinase n=1 Tax=Bowmanella yangjiangensis TaxID=2811230 RepID=UPI001BDD67AF|nr:sugar kinase [Bowmanella yangjiangensis]MBT1063367.1 sugar kinase [Bowmanella yangjiangensis]